MKKIILPIMSGIIAGALISAPAIFLIEKNSAIPKAPQAQTGATTAQTTNSPSASPQKPAESPTPTGPTSTPENEVIRFMTVLFLIDPPNSLEAPEAKEALNYLSLNARNSLDPQTGLAGFAKTEKLDVDSYTVLGADTQNNTAVINMLWNFKDPQSQVNKSINFILENNSWKIDSVN